MKTTGFGGNLLNFRRFEENGKNINIDSKWGDLTIFGEKNARKSISLKTCSIAQNFNFDGK